MTLYGTQTIYSMHAQGYWIRFAKTVSLFSTNGWPTILVLTVCLGLKRLGHFYHKPHHKPIDHIPSRVKNQVDHACVLNAMPFEAFEIDLS